MKKVFEKIAIVTQVSIALVFVLTAILYMAGAIPQTGNALDNGFVAVLMIVLAVAFALLSAYIVYVNFSQAENLKRILLATNPESSTETSAKIVHKIVRGCAKEVEGIQVRRIRVRTNEKRNLMATITVNVSTPKFAYQLEQLRLMLADNFLHTLGLKFASIDFEIKKFKIDYKPNAEKAKETAKTTVDSAKTEQNADPVVAKTDSEPVADTSLPQPAETAEPTPSESTTPTPV